MLGLTALCALALQASPSDGRGHACLAATPARAQTGSRVSHTATTEDDLELVGGVLLTSRVALPHTWQELLDAVRTGSFEEKRATELGLVSVTNDGEVYLFDEETLGFEESKVFNEILGELKAALASGRNLQDTKLSQTPPALAKAIRQRFAFHKGIELAGLDSLDLNFSLAAGIKLRFDRNGKSVSLDHVAPYTKPSVTVAQKRTTQGSDAPASPGPLNRKVLGPKMVAHFSDPLTDVHVLLARAGRAYSALAEHVKAASEATRRNVDEFWELAKSNLGDGGLDGSKAASWQDLPSELGQGLMQKMRSSYAHFGFSSASAAEEFLRFSTIGHVDRELNIVVNYSIEGQPGSFELVLSTLLDHR